jgi:DNA-binding transcriptional MerR regulator
MLAAAAIFIDSAYDFELTLSQAFFMTIGELSARSNLPASTIRYWEQIHILPRPERTGGKRRYTETALDRIAILRLAQACGFRLEEMRQLLNGFPADVPASRRWRELAGKKKQELDAKLAQIHAMRDLVDRVMGCRCTDLGICGRRARNVLDGTLE